MAELDLFYHVCIAQCIPTTWQRQHCTSVLMSFSPYDMFPHQYAEHVAVTQKQQWPTKPTDRLRQYKITVWLHVTDTTISISSWYIIQVIWVCVVILFSCLIIIVICVKNRPLFNFCMNILNTIGYWFSVLFCVFIAFMYSPVSSLFFAIVSMWVCRMLITIIYLLIFILTLFSEVHCTHHSLIVWRIRGNIIRTALCWIVWHNVHSQQHTYMSSSYRSNRLGLSHWDPYTMCRGGCLESYYCNMVEWF